MSISGKNRIHFYTECESGTEMVELHIDDLYAYDDSDTSNLPLIGPLGDNVSPRIPPNQKPVIIIGQDEAIYRSSQLNESC